LDLNKNYIQKRLTPYHEFGHITPTQWALLVAEKTTSKALARSAKNSEQVKKNQHHSRLGPSGYAGKEEQFRKIDAETEDFGNTKVMRLKPHI
jgi:hypothetical protein